MTTTKNIYGLLTMMMLLEQIRNEDIELYYIDLFCGAGGTSTGVELATVNGKKVARVIVCVNHDINAIASHFANHPHAVHFTEDIRTLDLSIVVSIVKKIRLMKPNAKIVLWASLECTNFSKAKGGLPRDADSRTLADHLFRYIQAIDPDYIQIENVEEFMSWGDLDENGKPISKDKGRLYLQWVNDVNSYGYKFNHRILNAADFGAYTSRKRFFGQFAKKGLPITWPKPTHSKTGQTDLFDSLLKWNPVKDCLDFTDEGESIFGRKKELVEASLDRVLSGLVKFVAGGKDKWLMKYNSVNKNTKRHNPPSVDDPCPVIGCQDRLGVIQTKFIQQRNTGNPESKVFGVDRPARTVTSTGGNMELVQTTFLSKQYSGHPDSKNISIEGPAHTITNIDHHAKVTARFITKYYSGKPDQKNYGVDEPAHTLRTKDSQALICAKSFLSAYYGNGFNTSLDSPAPTVTTKDRLTYVNPQFFVDMQYGNGTPSDIYEPAPTVTTNPKHYLVQCDRWLMNTNFGNVGNSLDEPAPVVTANRKWHYLMDAQYSRIGNSVEKPCFTLIARMDKTPPYLIEASTETRDIPSFIRIVGDTIIYEIYDTDSPKTKEIKEFMALYGIIDIKMRMLRIPELKMIMGFPVNYVLKGTQADQKKFIGNAVEVTQAKVMCQATAIELKKRNLIVA